MDKVVRIGCASAFWGDTTSAAAQLVRQSSIDYLVFDYLSEATMSVLANARMRQPGAGYAREFVTEVMTPLLKDIARKEIKVVSNAGGINLSACREALNNLAQDAGLSLKIALVEGDNLLHKHEDLMSQGITDLETGALFPQQSISINAYLGAKPIADALSAGADIVLTGRTVDSALHLGPLMHEFGWALDDYDKLAQGSLVGHILEGGAQCCGGNFTDWTDVPNYDDLGFPIAECQADGRFVITKPKNTGGLINRNTIREQILHKIGDPKTYRLPNVICDFSQVSVEDTGPDQVTVSGAKGQQPANDYKVIVTWMDGFRCSASFMLSGIDAQAKGQRTADAILAKTDAIFTARKLGHYTATRVDIIGAESTYGAHARQSAGREVVVRIAVAHSNKAALDIFAREIAHAAGMAPGATCVIGGMPKASPIIRLFSCLLPKTDVPVTVDIDGEIQSIEIPLGAEDVVAEQSSSEGTGAATEVIEFEATTPLIKLALARSGNRANHVNIGVIARQSDYLPYLRAALTESTVAEYMQHILDEQQGTVSRWELPGIDALNFLLENALDGGGMAGLRADSQGRALAQQLLEFPVPIPTELAEQLTATDNSS
ncbi:MAG: acyclic terpene utilization AtuA family protein [Pseudomonadota bacterium]